MTYSMPKGSICEGHGHSESYPKSEEDIKHVSNCMDIIPKVFSQGGRSN